MFAQVINFAIVVGVLWYFAFKPLSQQMADRTQSIEKGLQEAELAAQALKDAHLEQQVILKEARQQAQELLLTAQNQSEARQQAETAKAKQEVMKIVQEGKLQLARDREQMMREVQTELADLVTRATSKVLGDTVDKKIDKKVVENAVSDLSWKNIRSNNVR